MEKIVWAAACAGKKGAFHATLRALDQRAKIVGIYRERGKPDWDGVKRPAQRKSRPRPRPTWTEPRDRLKPHGLVDQGESKGHEDPNLFIVLKSQAY